MRTCPDCHREKCRNSSASGQGRATEAIEVIVMLKKPTKKYIASLLGSEDIIPRPESIEQCLYGWHIAANTPRAEREQRVRAVNQAVFHYGDAEMIGYCTYTCLTMIPDLSHFRGKPKQLRMEI